MTYPRYTNICGKAASGITTFQYIYGPVHKIWVLIASGSNKDSGLQFRQCLCCSHIWSMDEDKGSDQHLDLDMLV